jgi:mannose-1-phosphate guanylyltransferase
MIKHTYAVIMAGGGGTRLWPLSRRAHPKQTLSFGRPRTLFQMTVDRLEALLPPEQVLVVTIAEQAAILQEQVPAIPQDNYLIEPLPRGTASVVGLAAVALRQRDPEAAMIVLAADHFIENVPFFQEVLKAGLEVARQDYLVTLGITPTFASTGYGYIQFGETLGEFVGQTVHKAVKFKEKPSQDLAEQFLAGGDHVWNSGMFIWQVSRILAEIRRLMPELAVKLDEIERDWNTPRCGATLQAVWPTIRSETIDFGVMEKAERVAVVPAKDLQWDDVGSWESLFDVLPGDAQGNVIVGSQHIGIDTRNTLVLSEVPGRLVATIGVDDLIVIDTGNALLICPRSQAQKVRQVVDRLKQEGRDIYL